MFAQQIGGLRLLLAENRHQDVSAGHFATPGRLDVEDRALQNTLEAERRLCFTLFFTDRQNRRGLFDEGFEFLTQRHQINRARFQRFTGRWIAKQSQQQMLDGHKLMTVLARSGESHV